jgi:hypothetical protein
MGGSATPSSSGKGKGEGTPKRLKDNDQDNDASGSAVEKAGAWGKVGEMTTPPAVLRRGAGWGEGIAPCTARP